MLSTQVEDGLRIYYLPTRVDTAALQHVVRALEALPARGQIRCALDFTGTTHIRYRDLQQFARTVRARFDGARPILLTSLTAYCREIVRFALAAEDWDLFQEAERVVAAGPALGSAEPARPASNWGRDLRVGVEPAYPVPSLN